VSFVDQASGFGLSTAKQPFNLAVNLGVRE
jgi:hypothetical protein